MLMWLSYGQGGTVSSLEPLLFHAHFVQVCNLLHDAEMQNQAFPLSASLLSPHVSQMFCKITALSSALEGSVRL